MNADKNAINKRRGVAIAHLALSIFAFTRGTLFWGKVFIILQPQFWLMDKLGFLLIIPTPRNFIFHNQLNFIQLIALVVIWSLCFSWLFVKLDNWLNHFPVLGRKVF